jgi:hypothetical protein
MTYARKSGVVALWSNAVLKDKVTAFDLNAYAVTEKSYNSLSRRDNRAEIAVVTVLSYGLRSCHWSTRSFGG